MVAHDHNTKTPHIHLVPKDPAENLRFRRWVLDECRGNPRRQAQFKKMCREDLLFYINVFCWTHSPKDHPEFPDRLFITWPFQDIALLKIADAVGHHDLCLPKSREMGVSWMVLTTFEWRWHFWPRQTFLLASRKAELVDKIGSPTALFYKLCYLHENQPTWLLPTGREKEQNDPNRTTAHLLNADNGSVIDGEATVADLGHGGRFTAIGLDEHGRMPDAPAISTGTRDATASRIFLSTFNGTGGLGAEFHRFSKNPDCEQFRMRWTLHPEKVVGLYTSKDAKLKILDKEYEFPPDYKFVLDGKTRSPWYDNECRRSNSQREIDQQVDMIPLGSGDRFFASDIIESHRSRHVVPPVYRGYLSVSLKTLEPQWIASGTPNVKLELEPGSLFLERPLHVWTPLNSSTGRPFEDEFVVSADIGAGTGGDFTSNSALSVVNKRTGGQVATFAAYDILPKDFASFAIAVCKWFHDATLIWEDNGGLGAQFRGEVIRRKYPYVYCRFSEVNNYRKVTTNPGYHTPTAGPGPILDELQRAMKDGDCVVVDEATLDELYQYVWKNGKVVHDGSQATDSESGKMKAHGDRAVAMALAWEAARSGPSGPKKEPDKKAYPEGSLGWVMQQDELAIEKAERRGMEDWSFR